MKERKLSYIITLHSKYPDGEEKSFLSRVLDNYEEAKELMESIYKDAEREYNGKVGKYSNPEWLDENHHTVKVLHTITVAWLTHTTEEIYYLTDDIDDNIFSDKRWILE